MGTYDFTTRPNRLSQFTYKWQETESNPDLLQMWVADMDFLPHPDIQAAILSYAKEHVFGYNYFPDSLYQSVIDWEKAEHGYEISKEDIVFIEGVVPSISIAIQAFTEKGDAVLINSPVYYPFARTIKLNERKLIENSLQIVDGRFEIDFAQLEKELVENDVKLYVLCSPHNPGGRVWSQEDLYKIGQICQKHGVILVSDEIHQDLALYGNKHHSFNTVDDSFKEFTIILGSATKTFNIAGTKNSFAIIQNEKLRKAFQRQQLANNQHEVPTIGMVATEAAFKHGKAWLEEFKSLVEENIDLVVAELESKTKIKVMKPEGTYLVWLDFSAYGIAQPDLDAKLRKEAKVVLNDGAHFGKEGKYFARLNVATPKATVEEALNRIISVFGD
ncbi:MalY/PatB family protein [Streptococcus loxodontisalivarius]|uniref:cysteine-S-conjugate beta-lyase n=1 Tax=Streptococcus loxodontisalivarius TaxID=1349415 RepID=A0ABS2PVN4_9STRE|nr:MalY/PatB family protein [Streptococcus loxodontisalivarius]MBM7643590.1 cystathionine beta-lyase [Streptococcus loxodontisalivarius]